MRSILLFCSIFVLARAAGGFLNGGCDRSSCVNGKCHRGPQTKYGGATHWCECIPEAAGKLCEKICDLECGQGEKCVFDSLGRPNCCNACGEIDEDGNQVFYDGCPVSLKDVDCVTRDFCFPKTCFNGGFCQADNATSASCVCPPGFAGEQCEIDIDECEDAEERRCNGGRCVNTYGSFKCACLPGTGDTDCSTLEFRGMRQVSYTKNDEQPACVKPNATAEPEPCRNGGFCRQTIDSNRTCVCPRGFQGDLCEQDIDECALSPCLNSGTCHNKQDGFVCVCLLGFEGEFCETNVDDCVNNECANGSTCVDGISRYTCECQNGTKGTRCEMIDPCFENPCLHGDCSALENGDFECLCDQGYQGSLCEADVNECLRQQCYHNGKCVNTPGSWRCECPRGFNGTRCEESFDTCVDENVVCENGGQCYSGYEGNREPICSCPQGFVGKRCESACKPGTGGVACDLNLTIPVCGEHLGKCLNGGKCIDNFCVCPAKYVGNRCEAARSDIRPLYNISCASDPCLNNATCYDITDNEVGYICQCEDGFEGELCEKRKKHCDGNPCHNGGSCVERTEGFVCACMNGTTGERCEVRQQLDCSMTPCANDGKCFMAMDGKSQCVCPAGFGGDRCTVNVDQFDTVNRKLQEACSLRNCSARAGDGACDLDCNFLACGFDGGDCSAKLQPFARCPYANFCANVFANNICDAACNNAECQFDGMDCLPAVPRCPAMIERHCAAHYADGVCNKECNSAACGFDGGDCEADDDSVNVLKDLRFKLLTSPEEFRRGVKSFLMEISSALRSAVRIQSDEVGPMIFEFSEDENVTNIGKRLKLDEAALKSISTSLRQKRRAAQREGVVVFLEVDVAKSSPLSPSTCDADDHSSCIFQSAQGVVDYVAADLSKKGPQTFGLPVYEARVSPMQPPRYVFGFTYTTLFAGLLAAVILVAAAFGALVHDRKRRNVRASLWCPGSEAELKKQSTASSQCSLLDPAFNLHHAKRGRFEYGQSIHSSHYSPPRFMGFFKPEKVEESAVTPGTPVIPPPKKAVIVKEPTPLIIQAESGGKITVEITKQTVNESEGLFGRTALHWVCANSRGKPEEVIVEEAQRLIAAGANLDVKDSDGDTPLLLAVRSRRQRLALILLNAGADPCCFNNSLRSVLHETAVNSDISMARVLLRYEGVVKEIDEINKTGCTPLMEVARNDMVTTDFARLLIQYGAKVEADGGSRKESCIYKGRTALHYAAQINNMVMVEFLLMSNANKDKQDEQQMTPLMLAAKEGHIEIVKYLVQHGASVESVDQMERTAKMMAADNKHQDVVDYLASVSPTDVHLARLTEAAVQQHLVQQQPLNAARLNSKKTSARPSTKAVKRIAARRGTGHSTESSSPATTSPSNLSRDSAIHLTPPPSSEGSLSSPSPPTHYGSSLVNPAHVYSSRSSSGGSSMHSSHAESSPEYHHNDSVEMMNSVGHHTMWHESPPYDPQHLYAQQPSAQQLHHQQTQQSAVQPIGFQEFCYEQQQRVMNQSHPNEEQHQMYY